MVESIAVKVVGGILAVIAVMLAIPKLFGRTARIRRKVGAVKQQAIRELVGSATVPERGRIAGMVVAMGEPLIAPLSRRACVFYETRVIRTVGLDIDPWDIEYEIASERKCASFLVDDGTGLAAVDARHVQTLLEVDVDRWAGDRKGDTAAEDAFLARFGQRRRGWLLKKRLHFTESFVEVGERVAVMGTILREKQSQLDNGAPYRHAPAPGTSYPRLEGSKRSPVIVSDDPTLSPALDDD